MHHIRQKEIHKAATGQVWGLVLGSLGRQGSPKVLQVEFSLLPMVRIELMSFCFSDNKTTFEREWQKIHSSDHARINAR